MALLDTLFGTLAGVGQSFLANELNRKAQKRAVKAQMYQQGPHDFGLNGGQQFPRVGQPSIRQPLPGGGTVQAAIPSGLSNRQFKAAMCKAVRERLVHPAQATAELKMRGMKGCTRRMNPLNPRALTRAARRMEGFLRTVKRIEKAIPTKTRKVRARGHSHALQSTGVVRDGG